MRSRTRWEYFARAPKILRGLMRDHYDFTFDLMPMHLENLGAAKRNNILRAGLNLLYRRLRPWSWPTLMQVELTNVCNLRCPVCPTGRGLLNRKPQMMDLALYERLMQEVGKYLLTVCLWAWGEPLLHEQAARAVRIAREHNVLPLVSTNGQNLDQPGVQQALVTDPPEYLIVAIDGLTQETLSKYRVGARLDRIIEGVKAIRARRDLLRQRLPRLHMRFIVMKHNQHEVPQVARFAREVGFDMLTVRTLSVIDDDQQAHSSLLPDGSQYMPYNYDGEQRIPRGDFVCQHAFAFPAVFADGTVVPCDQDYNASHAIGRFDAEHSFKDIWFGSRAAGIRRTIRDNRDALAFCRQCPYADRLTNTCSVQRVKLDTAAT